MPEKDESLMLLAVYCPTSSFSLIAKINIIYYITQFTTVSDVLLQNSSSLAMSTIATVYKFH